MSPRRRVSSAEQIAEFAPKLTGIGAVIGSRRRDRGLTQQQLADACGFQRAYLSALEGGFRNPTLITLFRVAQALGTTVAELFRDAGL